MTGQVTPCAVAALLRSVRWRGTPAEGFSNNLIVGVFFYLEERLRVSWSTR